MKKKQNTNWMRLFIISIVFIGLLSACNEQPSITKKYLPAQAIIIASQKIWVRIPKGRSRWMMQHDAYFILKNQKYPFRFTCEIGSYNTDDTIDVFYNPKRPETVVVYSIPEKALNLAEGGEYDSIYFNYDDVKAFFDSIHMHSKKADTEK